MFCVPPKGEGTLDPRLRGCDSSLRSDGTDPERHQRGPDDRRRGYPHDMADIGNQVPPRPAMAQAHHVAREGASDRHNQHATHSKVYPGEKDDWVDKQRTAGGWVEQ